LWLIPDTQEALKYWWPALQEKGKIFRVAATGHLHRAKDEHLHLWSSSLHILRERAMKYWKGEDVSEPDAPDVEIVFVGSVKVLEEDPVPVS